MGINAEYMGSLNRDTTVTGQRQHILTVTQISIME